MSKVRSRTASRLLSRNAVSLPAALASLSLLALLLCTSGRTALAATTEQKCLIDYGFGTNACTANDVDFGIVNIRNITNSCLDTAFGQATSDFLLEMTLTTNTRYDIAVWIGKNGIDPRVSGAQCHHEYVNPTSTSPTPRNAAGTGPFRIEESGGNVDACADIRDEVPSPPLYDMIFKTAPVTFDCTDPDDDGTVEVFTCSSWDNNANTTCNDITQAIPGTSSKCFCELANTDLCMPPKLEVVKTTQSATLVSSSPPNYTYDVVFRVRVKNVGLQDLNTINVLDNLDATFGAGTYSIQSAPTIVASSFSPGAGLTANAAFNGSSNTNLINTGATRRLDYHIGPPVSSDGDYASIEYTVRYTTTCPTTRTNTVTANALPVQCGTTAVTAQATSSVGCTPNAVTLKSASAETGSQQGTSLAILLGSLGLAGLVVLYRRSRESLRSA